MFVLSIYGQISVLCLLTLILVGFPPNTPIQSCIVSSDSRMDHHRNLFAQTQLFLPPFLQGRVRPPSKYFLSLKEKLVAQKKHSLAQG